MQLLLSVPSDRPGAMSGSEGGVRKNANVTTDVQRIG